MAGKVTGRGACPDEAFGRDGGVSCEEGLQLRDVAACLLVGVASLQIVGDGGCTTCWGCDGDGGGGDGDRSGAHARRRCASAGLVLIEVRGVVESCREGAARVVCVRARAASRYRAV